MSKTAIGIAFLGLAGAVYAVRSRTIEDQIPELPDWSDLIPGPETNQDHNNMHTDQARANLSAMMRTIIKAEGTDQNGRDPYATVYNYAFTITDFSDHPANRGWKGVKLPAALCLGAGRTPGCVSTAAGAYQITDTTWDDLRKSGVYLPDFSRESQDAACIALIKRRKALDDVYAGRFETALAKCAKEWASLPGAGYGQGERTLANLMAAYSAAGGTFA
jgi:lysozyme